MMAMAAVSTTKPNIQTLSFLFSSFHFHHHHRRLLPLSLSLPPTHRRRSLRCSAAKSPTGPVEKKKKKPNSATSSANRKRKPKRRDGDGDDSEGATFSEVEIVESPRRRRSRRDDGENDDEEESLTVAPSRNLGYYAAPMPNPPAGFVVDEHGRVLMASNKRIATIVDPTNNFPLECTIRRIFKSSRGDDCMLLCPVDTPVQMLKSTNIEGWSAVSDEEVEAILPTAAFALAKIHMHLVHSGFCYTARGGFCYTEDDIFDFRSDDGQDVDGLPTEGVEITSFHVDGSHYMIYTPADPLLFVAVKGDNGMLHIADDDLLDDSAVISAIDEETEFNALVEEEAALLDTLMGKE